MRRLTRILILSAGVAGLAACGANMQQRAATGAITGAVVAGPVGAPSAGRPVRWCPAVRANRTRVKAGRARCQTFSAPSCSRSHFLRSSPPA